MLEACIIVRRGCSCLIGSVFDWKARLVSSIPAFLAGLAYFILEENW